MVRVLALDGPSGSGKSTVARILADRLKWFYLNTGAMYRAIGLYLARNNVACNEESVTSEILADVTVDFNENGAVLLNGQNVADDILSMECARFASDYSRLPAVRKRLTELQRQIGLSRPSVVEGRDIGTVVFPDADHKFFIIASPIERARRRLIQLRENNMQCDMTLQEVLQQQMERDEQDASRALAPLVQAEDAVVVDTTEKTIDEVVEEILAGM